MVTELQAGDTVFTKCPCSVDRFDSVSCEQMVIFLTRRHCSIITVHSQRFLAFDRPTTAISLRRT